MTTLPTNTTDRLLALADQIVNHPDLWGQETWLGTTDGGCHEDPQDWAGKRHVCDTPGCIAGNAVMLTPVDVVLPESWEPAGAMALGLHGVLASYLFSGNLEMEGEDMAAVLRAIASLPEGERTVENLRGVLDPVLFDQLMRDTDDYDDDDEWEN